MGSDACINLLTTATDPELSSGSVHRARRTFSSTVRRAAARVSSIDTPFPHVTALSDPAICAARECVGAELGVPLHDCSGLGLDRRQCGPGLESRGARAAIGRRGRPSTGHCVFPWRGVRASWTMPGAACLPWGDLPSVMAALRSEPLDGDAPNAPTTESHACSAGGSAAARRVACICQSGFTEIAHRAGMNAIHEGLTWTEPLCHRPVCPILALEEWDASTDAMVEKIIQKNCDLIIHIGHSYGCGEGLVQLAAKLAARGRSIDLAVMIDPVWRYSWGRKRHACKRGQTFAVPSNVRNVMCWRTIHEPPFAWTHMIRPMGHAPVCGEGTTLLLDTVYGTAHDFQQAKRDGHDCGTHQVVLPSQLVYTHTTIDNADDVRAEVLMAVADFVRDRIAERSAA